MLLNSALMVYESVHHNLAHISDIGKHSNVMLMKCSENQHSKHPITSLKWYLFKPTLGYILIITIKPCPHFWVMIIRLSGILFWCCLQC